MPDGDRPLFVIVAGPPASGKSSIARWLAGQLSLPLISRDDFKETLMDVLGSPDPEASHELGKAAYAILALIQQRLVDAGVGMIVESNFIRGISEDDFEPIIGQTQALLVHCTVAVEESKRRFVERTKRGDRHPGHHDDAPEKVEELGQQLEDGDYDPLRLPVPTLVIDTTDGRDIDHEHILAWIQTERVSVTETAC